MTYVTLLSHVILVLVPLFLVLILNFQDRSYAQLMALWGAMCWIMANFMMSYLGMAFGFEDYIYGRILMSVLFQEVARSIGWMAIRFVRSSDNFLISTVFKRGQTTTNLDAAIAFGLGFAIMMTLLIQVGPAASLGSGNADLHHEACPFSLFTVQALATLAMAHFHIFGTIIMANAVEYRAILPRLALTILHGAMSMMSYYWANYAGCIFGLASIYTLAVFTILWGRTMSKASHFLLSSEEMRNPMQTTNRAIAGTDEAAASQHSRAY